MNKLRPTAFSPRGFLTLLTVASAVLTLLAPGANAKTKREPKAEGTAANAEATKAAPTGSSVPRPAPDIAWVGAGGARQSLKKFRGQPVVVLIAPGADNADFRKEARLIEKRYLDMSARKIVFIAAFAGGTPARLESSIPFALAADGPGAAAAFGANGKFACVIIGPDGNVDLQSEKVEPAQRILDVVNNSQQPQATARKGQGS